MAPSKSKETKLDNEDVVMVDSSTGSNDRGEGTGGNEDGDADDGEGAVGKDGQLDDEDVVKPKKGRKPAKVPKSAGEAEMDAAKKAREKAATEALLDDRFVWKDGKPEPFQILREELKDEWEEVEGQNHCNFIERLHRKWEDLEQRTHDELLALKRGQPPISIDADADGEVEYVDFVWTGRNVHCETFLKVDLDNPKGAFKSSKILSNFDKKMAEYDKLMSDNTKTRARLAPYLVAKDATDLKLGSDDDIKDLIAEAYASMNDLSRDECEEMIEDGKRVLKGDRVEGFLKSNREYIKRYSAVTKNWESWGSGHKKWTSDKKMKNDRNLYASDPGNDILRRPCFDGDVSAIYIAFDRNEKIIIFLDPLGIPWSYDEDIHQRMRTDSHEFYSKIKRPTSKDNKRHISEGAHLKDNPAIKRWWSGSDHYGHWHAKGHPYDPILETSDSVDLTATQKQLLLQFLKYTGGPMTRVLDFWFGVWQRDLRQRYRDIYARSPEFARLPPVNEDNPETYTLRVAVCNRPTDEHRDQRDMKGGMTGLVHLGNFKGGAMCFNQLGIALDGYADGAVLLIRGTELKHYISQWWGNYRYAFDHTTHQSIEDQVKIHEETGRWGPKKDPEAPKPPKPPKGGKGGKKPKNPDDDDDDEKPDGGDESGKPDENKKKRPREDDEEKPDGDPKSKQRKGETQERSRDKEKKSDEDPALKNLESTGTVKVAKLTKRLDDEDDKKPDVGPASGKSNRKTKKRSRDDDDDEEPNGRPAPKKLKGKTKEDSSDGHPVPQTRGNARATRGVRQTRPAKGKGKQIKEEQSGAQLPARDSPKRGENPRQTKGVVSHP